MGNKFRDIFDLNSNYNKELERQIEVFKEKMIQDKCCCYCSHSHEVPHIEMGKDGGTDTYCEIFDELKLGYAQGQQCIFWDLRIK